MTAIILLLVLILLCMFKTVRIVIGLDARRSHRACSVKLEPVKISNCRPSACLKENSRGWLRPHFRAVAEHLQCR